MAQSILTNNHISIRKGFFGFGQSVLYTPTNSIVDIITDEYAQEQGERLRRLLTLSPSKLAEELHSSPAPRPTAVGPYRLEACISRDGQFTALQLFRYAGMDFEAVSAFVCVEGNEAGLMAQLIRN